MTTYGPDGDGLLESLNKEFCKRVIASKKRKRSTKEDSNQQHEEEEEEDEDDDDYDDDYGLPSFRPFGFDLDPLLKRHIHFISPPPSYHEKEEFLMREDGQLVPKSHFVQICSSCC